jgi:signal transduction histidine kinase
MSAQSPLEDGLYIRQTRPDRRWILVFVRYYPYLIGGLVSLIVFSSLFFVDPVFTLLLLGGYWLYLVGRIRVRKYERWAGTYSSPFFQLARVLILIVIVTFLISYAHQQTGYLERTQDDVLWLLYVPALYAIGQRGSRDKFLLVLLVVIACLCWIYLGNAALRSSEESIPREIVVKSSWLILLSLTPYILVRYMGDTVADLNLIINVQNRIRQMEGGFLRSHVALNENKYIEKAVEIISSDLSYDHVNIFRLDKNNNQLICIAGACQAGKKLAQAGYGVDIVEQKSVIGHVAQKGKPYISNNALSDPIYLPHEAFPDTRAELVVPIRVRNRLYGVLDIQVHQSNFFLEQDLKAIEILANHIGWVIDNSEQFAHINWVNRIIETIATPIFTQNHLEETLQEIADSALRQLNADLVFLYSCDPGMGNSLSGPIYAGDLLRPELIDPNSIDDDNVVSRLVSDTTQLYINENLETIQWEEHPLFRPSQTHIVTSKPTFIEREGIKSNVIIRLLNNDGQCVGVLFLNFREVRSFSEWERKRYFSFAHLAGLAIQKMQLQQQIIQKQKNELSNWIHDILIGDTVGLFKILRSIQVPGEKSANDKLRKKLSLAIDATEHLHNDIRWIKQLLDGDSSDNLLLEIDKLFMLFRQIFDVNATSKWTGDMNGISPEVGRELSIVIREALTNAVRHGKAQNLHISGVVRANDVNVTIIDDGTGFDPKVVKRMNGLLSMNYRIKEMGGVFKLNSNPGRGTKIVVTVPLQNATKGA